MSGYPFKGSWHVQNVSNDGTDSTVYSDPIVIPHGSVWSAHLVWTEDTATFATAVTLWATNVRQPSLTDDTDWVQMVSGHGWDGFTGGDPAGGDGKDFSDIGNTGGALYRFKFVRSTGAATLNLYLAFKDSR